MIYKRWQYLQCSQGSKTAQYYPLVFRRVP